MTLDLTIRRILMPLEQMLPQGDAALVLVLHPGDLPPREVVDAVHAALEQQGFPIMSNRLDWFTPDLVYFMSRHPARVFSVFCPPDSVTGEHPDTLNQRRTPWLALHKGLILWIAEAAMPRLSNHASNFLDFHHTVVLLEQGETLPPPAPEPLRDARINIAHLPRCGMRIIGRSSQIAQLNDALYEKKRSLIALVAPAGIGKSALVEGWLESLHPHYGAASKIFGWSFYSQGEESPQTRSIFFFNQILPWLGHEGALPNSDEERATALAKRLQSVRTLLILDGIEPLQHNPASPDPDRVGDPALHQLLCILGHEGQPGLTLLTSRKPLLGMTGHYLEIPLERLSNHDGVELLTSLSVSGANLATVVETVHGHALTLNLLGRWLQTRHQGRIEAAFEQTDLLAPAPADQPGLFVQRILHLYDTLLWPEKSPERSFMRFLGLFDRPMESAPFQALQENLPTPLQALSRLEFNRLIESLQQAGLLLPSPPDATRWDAHPLIREYFGQTWQEQQPEEFRQANAILLQYFQSVPTKHQPDTLKEMEPLLRAVHHGCRAFQYQNVQEILHNRINHEKTHLVFGIGPWIWPLGTTLPGGDRMDP